MRFVICMLLLVLFLSARRQRTQIRYRDVTLLTY